MTHKFLDAPMNWLYFRPIFWWQSMNTRISLYVSGLILCSLMLGCANTSGTSGAASAGDSPVVYNVRAFGAKGDGKTIDSPAINKAIEAANAAGGGTVLFPPG